MLCLDVDSISFEQLDCIIGKLGIEHGEDLGCHIVKADFDKGD
jgi:hypothetical protein